MCQVLGVSRRCYYHYRQYRENRAIDPEHQKMLDWIKQTDKASDHTCGSRRMKEALNAPGFPISRTRARKLMHEAGVQVRHRKKYKVTTNSNNKQAVFDNLVQRKFDIAEPDQVYAADITYIRTQEGWLYLAVVIDLCTRKVVGWSMGSRMNAKLVCDALQMAIWRRRPEAGPIHHSDRGSQYASKAFKRLLKAHGIKGSMSHKGDCWDNAVVESLFGSLKQERVQWRHYQTHHEAQQDILHYISVFYNSYRLHSTPGYMSPNDFENQLIEKMKEVA